MDYSLYKFRFTSALHIGNDSGQDNLASSEIMIHSDTLFSALCIEAVNRGADELERLVKIFRCGKAVISDAFLFCGKEYFLPKPLYRKTISKEATDPGDRKLYKNLSYLPVSMFGDYIGIPGDSVFDVKKAAAMQQDAFFIEKRQHAAVKGQKETQPYVVGNVIFNDGCGLYIILGTEDKAAKYFIHKLLLGLTLSGIGGKRSTGSGKFDIEGPIEVTDSNPYISRLFKLLSSRGADIYITLNTSLPGDEEMDGALQDAYYMLCRRGGFVQSYSYAGSPQKKKTVYALSSGACVKKTYCGVFLNLARGGAHPVYRCLTPLFAGVEL